jgi:hypothetical protein
VLSGQELLSLCAGLSENGLLHYDYLLTGYIGRLLALNGHVLSSLDGAHVAGSETFLSSVLETLSTIQATNPNAK